MFEICIYNSKLRNAIRFTHNAIIYLKHKKITKVKSVLWIRYKKNHKLSTTLATVLNGRNVLLFFTILLR